MLTKLLRNLSSTFQHILTLSDTFQHFLAFSSTFWHFLTLFGTFWHILAHSGTFRCWSLRFKYSTDFVTSYYGIFYCIHSQDFFEWNVQWWLSPFSLDTFKISTRSSDGWSSYNCCITSSLSKKSYKFSPTESMSSVELINLMDNSFSNW